MTDPMETPAAAPTEMLIQAGWKLQLSDAGLRLSKQGEPDIQVLRAQVPTQVERVFLDFDTPFFSVLAPKRKAFRLSRSQADDFKRWLGDDYGAELVQQLKRRMGTAIPLGVFFVITDPRGILSWVLGGLMVVEGLLQRLRPSHWLFLLEALFWTVLLARNGWQISRSVQSGSAGGMALWAALSLLAVICLSVSVRIFRIFHRTLRKRA